MRRAAKVDGNQAEIVRSLRSLGASVESLAVIGCGCPDLLVGWRGRNYLFEVKDPTTIPSKRRLTPDQAQWFFEWRGQVVKVETIDEILAALEVP